MTEGRKGVLNRLRRTKGQIHEVQGIIGREKECTGAITQLGAIRPSIDRAVEVIVTENLRHCFENPKKGPKEQEERLTQVVSMIIKK